MQLLKARDLRLCEQDVNRRPCAFFSTFFYTQLIGYHEEVDANTFKYERVKKWSKKLTEGLFNYDKLFIPCHNGSNHWGACVVYLQARKIQYYDSLADYSKDQMCNIQKYLVCE